MLGLSLIKDAAASGVVGRFGCVFCASQTLTTAVETSSYLLDTSSDSVF